jgi:large subunit ribosomal protein L25
MTKLTLETQKRTVLGRKVKRERSAGNLPGSLFGKDIKSQSIFVKVADFVKAYAQAGETQVLYLKVGSDEVPVLISDIQKHPVTGEYLNVTFKNINLKEKVTASVPLEVVGEAPAVKAGLGTLIAVLDEVEVEALPTDIPEKFEIDVAKLVDLESVFTVADIKVDQAKVTINTAGTEIVAKVAPLEKVEEPVVVAPVEGETPAGETPAPAEGVKEEAKPAETSAPEQK